MLISTEVEACEKGRGYPGSVPQWCSWLMLQGGQCHSLFVGTLGYTFFFKRKWARTISKLLGSQEIKLVSNLKVFFSTESYFSTPPLHTHTPELGILLSASLRGNQQTLVCIAQVMRRSLHPKLLIQCLRIANVISLLHWWSHGWFPLEPPPWGWILGCLLPCAEIYKLSSFTAIFLYPVTVLLSP